MMGVELSVDGILLYARQSNCLRYLTAAQTAIARCQDFETTMNEGEPFSEDVGYDLKLLRRAARLRRETGP